MTVKLWAAFAMIVLFTTGFFGLDDLVSGKKFRDVSCRLDARVPLRPRWIWVYLLYYPVCLVPLALPGLLESDDAYMRAAGGFIVQFLVAWAFFYFYPTRIERLPVPGSGPSARALRGLYAVDGGRNIFPSLHVANSCYVAALSFQYLAWGPACALLAVAALISAATVLTKQHLLADLPSGAALGFGAYALAFRAF